MEGHMSRACDQKSVLGGHMSSACLRRFETHDGLCNHVTFLSLCHLLADNVQDAYHMRIESTHHADTLHVCPSEVNYVHVGEECCHFKDTERDKEGGKWETIAGMDPDNDVHTRYISDTQVPATFLAEST